MSLLTLFSKSPQSFIGPDPASGGSGLLLDAVLTEQIDHESKVTSFPVEIGADITDHVIIEPSTYRITGIVTDTPIHWSATKYNNSDAKTRSVSAYEILRELWKSRELFSIKTGFLIIKDVVLLSFSTLKDPARASVFQFDAVIQQINIVSSKEATITEAQRATAAAAATPEENLGPQQGEDADSFLKTGTDFLGNSLSELFSPGAAQ